MTVLKIAIGSHLRFSRKKLDMQQFISGSIETARICCNEDGAMYVRIIYDSHDPNYKNATPVRFTVDDNEHSLSVTVDKRHTRWLVGESNKFLNQTDKCLAKVMRAVINTHSKILDSFTFGSEKKDSFVMIVEVPEGNEKLFEQQAGVDLIRPPKVQIN